jgi:hypothetical protein
MRRVFENRSGVYYYVHEHRKRRKHQQTSGITASYTKGADSDPERTRYGCYLSVLTGLAEHPSAASPREGA